MSIQKQKKFNYCGEAGFTLPEAILVTVLMLIVFTAFGSFLLHFQKTAAEYNERAKQNEDSSLTAQALTKDLERVGTNLSLSDKQSFTGQVVVPFETNDGYQINGNRIVSTGSGSNPLAASIWWKGRGELKWTGNNFIVNVFDSNYTKQFTSDNSSIFVYENNEHKATVTRSSPDSSYSILVSTVAADGQDLCRTQYLVDGVEIYESSAACSLDSQDISVSTTGYINQLTLNAAEIILKDSGTLPVRLPLLPFYADQRMDLPFVQTESGFLLFGGDETQDAVYLNRDTTFSIDDNQTLIVNDAAGIASGDVLLVCDYLNQHSVLLQVNAVAANSLTVKPIYQATASLTDFPVFYTPVGDFNGFTFGRGTRVVKLAAPIEYSLRAEGNTTSLYRRALGSTWELVVPNLQNYTLSKNIQPSSVGFDISFDVLSEGIESGQTAQTVRLSVSPRSLNRTYDAR